MQTIILPFRIDTARLEILALSGSYRLPTSVAGKQHRLSNDFTPLRNEFNSAPLRIS